MPSKSVIAACKQLAQKELTIAFAESATTGRLFDEFASVPDCGPILQGSLVCYDVRVKKSLLGVTQEAIDKFTAESAEVTAQMAAGLKKQIDADVYVTTTGLAAPGGSETPEKPVGTMFAHLIVKGKEIPAKLFYTGKPEEIILKSIDGIAAILLGELGELEFNR